jgi:AmiR/NasT family two-component response regulator
MNSYFSTQSISLADVLSEGSPSFRILLAEPEDELYGIYAIHLREHRFLVHRSAQLMTVPQFVTELQPDLVIMSLHFPEGHGVILETMHSMRQRSPGLHMVSVGTVTDPSLLKTLTGFGVSGHVDRALSRPRDIALIAKTVLHI